MNIKKGMPTPDAALKEFFKDNEIFAAVFNGYFFNNDKVIDPAELEQADTAYTESVRTEIKIDKVNKYRDNVRKTSGGLFVILGIEDQAKIHYSMPVRKMLYDALGYSAEIASKGNAQDKKSWTVDERLSGVSKGTKVTPIITVVFYTGEEVWDGPRSVHDMMDIDTRVRQFVPDYPLYVIDLGHDRNLSFSNGPLEELRAALSAIYADTADRDEREIECNIMALAGILSGDNKLYEAAQGEGRQKMCKVLEKRDEKIYMQFKSQFEEMDAELAENRAELAENRAALEEKDAALEEKNAALEKKDAEIAALKAKLAELGH